MKEETKENINLFLTIFFLILVGVFLGYLIFPNKPISLKPISLNCFEKKQPIIGTTYLLTTKGLNVKVCHYSEILGHITYPCYKLLEEKTIDGIEFYKIEKDDGNVDLLKKSEYLKKFYIEEVK